MTTRTNQQIKTEVDAAYSETEASNEAFVKRFIEVYKLALAGDASAMAEGEAMYNSDRMNGLSMRVSEAMREAGLE